MKLFLANIKKLGKGILSLLFMILSVYSFGQTDSYRGNVIDSLGNPVEKARVYYGVRNYQYITTTRLGGYELDVKHNQILRITYPNNELIGYYQVKIDPFDGFVSLIEVEHVVAIKDEERTDEQITKHYPLKNGNGYDKTTVIIKKDTAEFVSRSVKNNGGYGIRFGLSSSISQANQKIKLQDEYVQGRPINGTLQHQPAATQDPFSWGPSAAAQNIPTYLPSIFTNGYKQQANLKLTGAYGGSYFSIEGSSDKEEGILKSNETDLLSFHANYERKTYNKDDLVFKFGVEQQTTEMPLAGYNYSQILFGSYNQPISFDAENNQVAGNSQFAASGEYNNPYFLRRYNQDKKENKILKTFVGHTKKDIIGEFNLSNSISFTKQKSNWKYGQIPTTITPPQNFYTREFDKNYLNHVAKFTNYDIGLVLSQQYQQVDLVKDEWSGYSGFPFSPTNSQDNNLYLENLSRYQFNANMEWVYKFEEIGDFPITNRLTHGIATTNTNQENLVYQYRNHTMLEFEFIYGLDLYTYFTVQQAYTEPQLVSPDLAVNTLNYSVNNFHSYTEGLELLYDKKPEFQEQSNHFETGLSLNNWGNTVDNFFNANFYYKKVKNAFVPVLNTTGFDWQNAVNYMQKGVELSNDFNVSIGYDGSAGLDMNLHSYKNKTEKINIEGVDHIPFIGFNDINKNYVVGEPVGSIVGSSFQRNSAGQLIIGDDGYPLVAEQPTVIGNPNPKVEIGFTPHVDYKRFALSGTFNYASGMDVWNGTAANLAYYGRSKLAADARQTNGYLFEGVTENGNINTTAVDFAPNTSVFENRYVRYGQNGVAEDFIERDIKYLLLQNIRINYHSHKKPMNDGLIKQYNISLFAENVGLWSNYTGDFAGSNMFQSASGIGLDYYNMPLAKRFGISFQLDF